LARKSQDMNAKYGLYGSFLLSTLQSGKEKDLSNCQLLIVNRQ
jgi:hypothetical protein